ncbi:unnamed protein product, partial [Staurois parvus]
ELETPTRTCSHFLPAELHIYPFFINYLPTTLQQCNYYTAPATHIVLSPPPQSCDSGVPIPSMDTGVYNPSPRHADGFYKHW